MSRWSPHILALVVFSGWLTAASAVAAQPAASQPAPTTARVEPRGPEDPFEKCTFTSSLDGAGIAYALWLPPEYDAGKTWPLIVFLHGSAEGTNWKRPTAEGASIPVRTAKADLPFVVVYPLMRGTWSITALAERDVLETIADVQRRVSVDPDRIHLTGISLGGFAAWRIACRYPDRFATVSPFCSGGEPELVSNLHHVPVRVYHGTADKGVSVKESRRMIQAAKDAEINVVYREMRDVGHTCWRKPYAGRQLYDWMTRHRRVTAPKRVSYRTHTLRHHRAYWLSVESMLDPGKAAYADVFVPDPGQILIHAENVARLRLAPPASVVPEGTTPGFFVNNQKITSDRLKNLSRGGWEISLVEDKQGSLRKRPGLSGPIQDVYYDPFIVVVPPSRGFQPARTSTRESARVETRGSGSWEQVAARVMGWADRLVFKNLRTIAGDEVTPEMTADYNLICFGNAETNTLLQRVADDLPLRWSGDRLHVEGQPASEDVVAFVMIYPNPLNPDRYIVVCSGQSDAVAQLAPRILQPPYLSRAPIEDLVVVTRGGELPLKAPESSRAPDARAAEGVRSDSRTSGSETWRSMADPVPPRGAVFDRNWKLTPDVKAILMGSHTTGRLPRPQ